MKPKKHTKELLAKLSPESRLLYAVGIRDGERRLARALRRFSKRNPAPGFDYYVKQWLSARQKRGK